MAKNRLMTSTAFTRVVKRREPIKPRRDLEPREPAPTGYSFRWDTALIDDLNVQAAPFSILCTAEQVGYQYDYVLFAYAGGIAQTGQGTTTGTTTSLTDDVTPLYNGTVEGRVRLYSPNQGNPGQYVSDTTTKNTSSVDGPLDLISATTEGAYSLTRRLTKNYLGSGLRLRRGTDQAESDFGFDGAGDIDEAGIVSWLGGANGYVVTLYDQSGNDRHMSQATALTQPQWFPSATDSMSKSSAYFVTANNTFLLWEGAAAASLLVEGCVFWTGKNKTTQSQHRYVGGFSTLGAAANGELAIGRDSQNVAGNFWFDLYQRSAGSSAPNRTQNTGTGAWPNDAVGCWAAHMRDITGTRSLEMIRNTTVLQTETATLGATYGGNPDRIYLGDRQGGNITSTTQEAYANEFFVFSAITPTDRDALVADCNLYHGY